MKALRLLANGNFITVNKCVAKSIGLNEAVILGALCSECVYCEGLNRIEDGFFPFSIEQLQEETTLGRKLQDKAIANLIASGIIEQKNCGVPNKRHFRIDEEKVEDLLLGRTSLSQQDTLVCPVGTNCIAPQGQTNSNKVIIIIIIF